MDCSVIINIFQLNAALGILYVGLPKFRFRENFYNTIVERINFHEYSETYRDEVKEARGRLLDGDPVFTNNHHYIRRVVSTLPDDYRNELTGSENFDSSLPEGQSSQPPARLHNWFADDRDKYCVGTLTIFVSIVALWICFFNPTCLEIFSVGWVFTAAFLGQLAMIVNVYLGQLIARRVRKKLNSALEDITDKLRKQQASLDTQTPPETFPSSEPDEPPPYAADDDLPF